MPSPLAHERRVLAFDRLRGLAMVLMAVDHAMYVFCGEKVAADSAYFGAIGQDLAPYGGPWHFLTRWITHLCAPVFLFLVGTSLAQSIDHRQRRGDSAGSIDVHLMSRGAMLIALEFWMSIAWGLLVIQVLWAIGASLVAFALLRRLPWRLVGALGATWIVGQELVIDALGITPAPAGPGSGGPTLLEALFLAPNFYAYPGFQVGAVALPGFAVVNYPVAGWLAIAMVGWAFGSWFVELQGRGVDAPRIASRLLVRVGLALLVVFALVRLADGYGNFDLVRTDDSWLRWLQVSKYPPSLAFVSLTLGVGALLLGLLLRSDRPGRNGPLVVFGQTALFFYLVHIHAMEASRALLALRYDVLARENVFTQLSTPLAAGWIGAVAALAVLYPACRAWRARRRRAT
ncbi:MAG: heparan-alpha-glucosaminide N-acetyltransferase domain-containing protein [Planctomycetota bacterium]